MRRILIERRGVQQRKIHGGGHQRQEFDPERIVMPLRTTNCSPSTPPWPSLPNRIP